MPPEPLQCKHCLGKKTRLFWEVPKRRGHVGQAKKAWIFKEMLEKHIITNIITYYCILLSGETQGYPWKPAPSLSLRPDRTIATHTHVLHQKTYKYKCIADTVREPPRRFEVRLRTGQISKYTAKLLNVFSILTHCTQRLIDLVY